MYVSSVLSAASADLHNTSSHRWHPEDTKRPCSEYPSHLSHCPFSMTLYPSCFSAVLDMARHVPLYRALLELLRAISTCTALVPLLLPLSGDSGQDEEEEDEEHSEGQTSVGMLLAKMKTCVDTYTNRLR